MPGHMGRLLLHVVGSEGWESSPRSVGNGIHISTVSSMLTLLIQWQWLLWAIRATLTHIIERAELTVAW